MLHCDAMVRNHHELRVARHLQNAARQTILIGFVKRRIDSLTGSFLFVDFGEFHSDRTPRNSITDTQQMAATVAMKLSDAADLPEVAIATDRTLALTARLRRMLIEDASDDRFAWMEEISQQHDITPFVAPEFNSIGWTLTFTVTAADLFGVKERE